MRATRAFIEAWIILIADVIFDSPLWVSDRCEGFAITAVYGAAAALAILNIMFESDIGGFTEPASGFGGAIFVGDVGVSVV